MAQPLGTAPGNAPCAELPWEQPARPGTLRGGPASARMARPAGPAQLSPPAPRHGSTAGRRPFPPRHLRNRTEAEPAAAPGPGPPAATARDPPGRGPSPARSPGAARPGPAQPGPARPALTGPATLISSGSAEGPATRKRFLPLPACPAAAPELPLPACPARARCRRGNGAGSGGGAGSAGRVRAVGLRCRGSARSGERGAGLRALRVRRLPRGWRRRRWARRGCTWTS